MRIRCIVCPEGCNLEVITKNGPGAGAPEVVGACCDRGKAFAFTEVIEPVRILATTVALAGGKRSRLAVRTASPIPRAMLLEARRTLNGLGAIAPVRMGDVILPDILGTGVDVVASASAPVCGGYPWNPVDCPD